jgi:transcriptional regulator with XRE-family HTH domain
MRELARELSVPVPSLHNYIQFDTLPRVDNIQKIADYFGESVSSMFSEDDDQTAVLIAAIRHMTPEQKQTLSKQLGITP